MQTKEAKATEQPDSRFKYWAFISYSHADEAWANWLHSSLERYRIPRSLVGRVTSVGNVPRRIIPIFRDRAELPSSANLSDKITEAINQSNFLIVICSPKAAVSRYVDQEIRTFKQIGGSERVLCFIVDGEPGASENPEAGQLEAFPAAVRYQVGQDGQITNRPAEPLAADARKRKDGKANAKLKLLAGMLGVGLDELKQRERERRRWRQLQIAGLMLLVALVIAGVWRNRQQIANEQALLAASRGTIAESLTIPEREAARRLQLTIETVTRLQKALGHSIPEANGALERALDENALRGAFIEDDDSADFGGWTWPVAVNTDGTRILVPSALGPTAILNADGDKVALLKDQEKPYEHDNAAVFTSGGQRLVTGGADGMVRLWATDGKLVGRIKAHAADTLIVDATSDGTAFLTVGCDQGSGYQSCEQRSARLWNSQGQEVTSFAGSDAKVVSAALSPDGNRVVTVNESGGMQFWTTSGQLIFQASGGSHWVSRNNFSPDGKQFISGNCNPFLEAGMFSPLAVDDTLCPEREKRLARGDDPQVRLYDVDGNVQAMLPGWRATFSPDGRRILTAGEVCPEQGLCRTRVYIWKRNGAALSNFETEGEIVDLKFSPDGQFVVTADETGTITARDFMGKTVSRFGGFLTLVTSFSISEDGNRLATVSCPTAHQGACLKRAIHVWDPNGPIKDFVQFPGDRDENSNVPQLDPVVNYSRDGTLLFAAPNDGRPSVVLNTKTRQTIRIENTADRVVEAWIDPAEQSLLTLEATNGDLNHQKLQLWNGQGQRIKTLAEISTKDGRAAPVGVSAGRIVLAEKDGFLEAWDWRARSLGRKQTTRNEIDFVDVSPTDATIVVDHRGVASIWDGQLNQVSEIDAAGVNPAPSGMQWSDKKFDTTYKAILTPDDKGVLIAGPKGVSMWDRTGQMRWNHDIDLWDFTAPQIGKDRILVTQCVERGRGLTIGSQLECYDSRAKLWNLNGEEIKQLSPEVPRESVLLAARFSSSNSHVITVDREYKTTLWDADGNPISELAFPVLAASFHPDGKSLVTISPDRVLQVWQIWNDVGAMLVEAERRLQRLTAINDAMTKSRR